MIEAFKRKIKLIILNDKEEVLLIKERTEGNSQPKWNIVSGTLEEDELPHMAAIREAKEEASATISYIQLLGVYSVQTFLDQQLHKEREHYLFRARTKDTPQPASDKEQASRNEQIEAVEWFTPERICTMEQDEFVGIFCHDVLSRFLTGTLPVMSNEDYRVTDLHSNSSKLNERCRNIVTESV